MPSGIYSVDVGKNEINLLSITHGQIFAKFGGAE